MRFEVVPQRFLTVVAHFFPSPIARRESNEAYPLLLPLLLSLFGWSWLRLLPAGERLRPLERFTAGREEGEGGTWGDLASLGGKVTAFQQVFPF